MQVATAEHGGHKLCFGAFRQPHTVIYVDFHHHVPWVLVIVLDVVYDAYFISVGIHRAGLGQPFDVCKFDVVRIARFEQVDAFQEVEPDKERGNGDDAGEADFDLFREIFHKFFDFYCFFLNSEMASLSGIFWPALKATMNAPSKSSLTRSRILTASR